jgi:hypothetical protein
MECRYVSPLHDLFCDRQGVFAETNSLDDSTSLRMTKVSNFGDPCVPQFASVKF